MLLCIEYGILFVDTVFANNYPNKKSYEAKRISEMFIKAPKHSVLKCKLDRYKTWCILVN